MRFLLEALAYFGCILIVILMAANAHAQHSALPLKLESAEPYSSYSSWMICDANGCEDVYYVQWTATLTDGIKVDGTGYQYVALGDYDPKPFEPYWIEAVAKDGTRSTVKHEVLCMDANGDGRIGGMDFAAALASGKLSGGALWGLFVKAFQFQDASHCPVPGGSNLSGS